MPERGEDLGPGVSVAVLLMAVPEARREAVCEAGMPVRHNRDVLGNILVRRPAGNFKPQMPARQSRGCHRSRGTRDQ